jgi:hypothetical protein
MISNQIRIIIGDLIPNIEVSKESEESVIICVVRISVYDGINIVVGGSSVVIF